MRIAALCGVGFGTSMMLKLFIDDILKAGGLNAETIHWDLSTFKGQQADIVVAPTDMAVHLRDTKSKVVLIRNLIDKKELREKLLAAVYELQGKA